jgi:hypothetical protein
MCKDALGIAQRNACEKLHGDGTLVWETAGCAGGERRVTENPLHK